MSGLKSSILQYATDTYDIDAVKQIFLALGCLENLDQGEFYQIYFDTFDWRLFAAGLLLYGEGRGRQEYLVLVDASDNAAVQHTLVCRRRPRFSQDLPSGALQQQLASVLKMRALLPITEIKTHKTLFKLRNSDRKTVVRALVEQSILVPEHSGQRLKTRITLQPVRGYDDWLVAARNACDESHLLEPVAIDQLSEALAATGRQTCDYSSKLNIQLTSEMRADHATKHILLNLLNTLSANIEGTKANIDSEFLHDFRVAVRRTRSALSQIKQVFEPDVVEQFREAFNWLGQITGPTRDLDVYLLEYQSYRASLPARMCDELSPFYLFLLQAHKKEQRILRLHLEGQRFTTLHQAWHQFLQQPVPANPEAAYAAWPVKRVADQRIWRMYRRVIREGRAISPESAAKDLHELRKKCKKLRYLIEFFSSLYDADQVRPLIKILKRLLDNLGEFQDLEVHADHLHGFAAQMQQQGEVPLKTLLAMGALVGSLLQRQQMVQQAFADCFSGFDTGENRACYRQLFKPDSADKIEGNQG